MIVPRPQSQFVELHRTFHELSEDQKEIDEAQAMQSFGLATPLDWQDLIKEFRVVILSEAGSGKTVEIRNVARSLRQQGRPAFFLRLEHIFADFEGSFEVGSILDFEKWEESCEEGWILLDSVDEARLRNARDFEQAIRTLRKRIITALERSHIVITSRTSAWRPRSDLNLCIECLGCPTYATNKQKVPLNDDSPEGELDIQTETNEGTQPTFKIVSLDDLTQDQVTRFAVACGIADSKVFIDAVERADAWAFTSRPQDLEELIAFWLDNGRIGTRLEIMENSIDRRLSERDQDRAEICPLSADRARRGARLLAAAVTLANDQVLRVPDGTQNSIGIAVKAVLSDWGDKELLVLLSRPIFDEAIYGTVRFHHRSVREYLTAEWLIELLKRETSRRNIESLFFRNQYDLDIVVPTLRPILPWLAIFDERIRDRVCHVSPEILFEGGDPSRLPLELRRSILKEVCKRFEDDGTANLIHEYSAVQRFSSADLSDDVCALIRKYDGNRDLTAFLLRMVWLGQLSDALPEVMNIALRPSAERYERITAFRAIKAIGSEESQEKVRQSFLSESLEIKRDWLSELIRDTQATQQTLPWFFACLEKCEANSDRLSDQLGATTEAFTDSAEINLLPGLVEGFNRLLRLPPMIEHPHYQVSEKFFFLLGASCKAVERLLLHRHPAALQPNVLAILHKFAIARDYSSNGLIDVKVEFSSLVPGWQELNRELFWFGIQRTRESVKEERGERLTDFRRASIFGAFWRFDKDDFDYVVEEIFQRAFIDDQLVALSLAFYIYRTNDRPREWQSLLKKRVSGNDELSACLQNLLHPPAIDSDLRKMNKEDAEWKKRLEIRDKKNAENQAGWRKYLEANLRPVKMKQEENPGIITNEMRYLLIEARRKKQNTSRWSEYNWKSLSPLYGNEIAGFFRDGAVAFWRNHKPRLRSEGASFNSVNETEVLGLMGIEIEAIETRNWSRTLNSSDVERACRYASFEMNGFPTWLPKLFETHPNTVCDFFMKEIQFELSAEKKSSEMHYVLSDISWSGQWAWGKLAPNIYQILKTREPKNLSNLDKLLIIVQGSNLSDELIAELAFRKCRSLKKLDHLARWFAVWTGVSPETAIPSFKKRIENIPTQEGKTHFAMVFVTQLLGERRGKEPSPRGSFKTPLHLKELYLLMQRYIRSQDDITRVGGGCYSPGLRDAAQDARNGLLKLLNQIPGKEAFLAMMEIGAEHPEKASRPWIIQSAKAKAEQDGDNTPWLPSQVKEFHENLERTPRNHKELADLAVLRLGDIKDDLEHGDSSIAGILRKVTQETEMRKFFGRELRAKANGRYSIPQEEELADAKRPDLRFHGVNFDGPVPIELKLVDKWTGPELFERLKTQLCGDYLRDSHSTRGIYLLIYKGTKKRWDIPGSKAKIGFSGLIMALQGYWRKISPMLPKVENITVLGIDLTKRSKVTKGKGCSRKTRGKT